MSPKDSLRAANDALQAGVEALARGDLETALASFEQSLTLVPENHIALQNLAAIAVKRNSLEEAEAYLLRINSANATPEMLLDLAKIQVALGKTAPAIQAYRSVIEINPAYTDAILAYARLVWPDAPKSAIEVLEEALKRGEAPQGRRDVLQSLILYKEIESRRTIGLAPYHADELSHMTVRHCAGELEDLCRTCGELLDTEPNDRVSRLAYAKALHAQGDLSGSQENFHALSAHSPGQMSSAVHFDDDFTAQAAAADMQSVPADLPNVHYTQEQDFGDGPVIVISSDARYFVHFTKPLVLSLDRQGQGCCVHVHIMDAPPDLLKDAKDWCSSLGAVRCAISTEDTGLAAHDPNDAAPYYHAIRFVRFVQLRERYDGPLWMIDADALANKNPDALFRGKGDWDVALRVRPGRLEPWNVVSAGLVGMANTTEALAFFTYVASYISQVRQQGGLPWGVDQMALYSALLRFKPERLRLLAPLELDVDVQKDGLFWFLSGARKALFPSLVSEPDRILSMLNDRERHFAEAYLTYLS